ncbi:flagellar hook-length control protein FliK [Pseudomonas sp. SH1-B]
MNVLQLINPNVQASPAGQGADALPAGFAQAPSGTDTSAVFDLQMAVQGFVAAQPALPDSDSAAAPQIRLTEADAEQWLAGVLGQQAVRIEAREAQPQEPDRDAEELEHDEQGDALPDELLVQAQPPVREPLPKQPHSTTGTSAVAPVLSAQAQVAPPVSQVATEVAVQMASQPNVADTVEIPTLERLPGAASDGDKVGVASPAATQATAAAPAAERHLKLHAPQAQWGEQMLNSLREHVDLQINQRIQNATIRLDPPELGSLEIFLSHESGRLSVQLSAANADVARLLQQTSDRLRQELVGQNFVQVNVQVSADAQGGRQQGQPRQAWLAEETVQAASITTGASATGKPDSTSDVLVTV